MNNTVISSFPLYNNLLVELTNTDLTIKQKEELIHNINSIDNDGMERVYLLVWMYSIDNPNTVIIPECLNGTIEFNLNELPARLNQLLYKFIDIHKKTCEEDNKRFGGNLS